jgi:hypothetical protein
MASSAIKPSPGSDGSAPVVHLHGEATHLKSRLLSIPVKVLEIEAFLICHQQVVHWPKPPLRPGALSGFGCLHRKRVNDFLRKVFRPADRFHQMKLAARYLQERSRADTPRLQTNPARP